MSSFFDPFGTDARREGLNSANAAINAAAEAYQADTKGLDYNVSPAMIQRYMSPDVAYRQNAATQALAQLYGNSGALRSSAAMSGIANANANIAAQAWNDAFGRASGILGQNNALAVNRAQSMLDAQFGIAGNKAAAAAGQTGWLTNTANALGGIGQAVSAFRGKQK